MRKREKGITLVALVITIIVLLVLAGVSIATLTGDNGILKKAREANDLTTIEEEKEQIELAYVSALMEKKYQGKVSVEDIKKHLKKNGIENVTIATGEGNTILVTFQDTSNQYTITEEGDVISPNETIEKDPEITISKEITELKEGDYVEYIDKNQKSRMCRVLYDMSSNYGIQIITVDTLKEVTEGGKDFYDNIATVLNTEAREYLNSDYATDARCVGSNPNSEKVNETNIVGTENEIIDVNKMKSKNLMISNNDYWLAVSGEGDGAAGTQYFSVYCVDTSGNTFYQQTYTVSTFGDNKINTIESTYRLRPIFMLKQTGIEIVKGKGTQNEPYKLGIKSK